MNWVTTNIRLPEDLYMELKMEAAKRRTSVAALVREKIAKEKKVKKTKDANRLIKELQKFAKKMARQNPGISLSQKLIEMRYEQ